MPAYKVYTARVGQTGTAPLAATVLEKTIVPPANWTRSTAGVYELNSTGAFTSGTQIAPFGLYSGVKSVWLPIVDENIAEPVGWYTLVHQSADIVQMQVVDSAGNFVDLGTLIGSTELYLPDIRVY